MCCNIHRPFRTSTEFAPTLQRLDVRKMVNCTNTNDDNNVNVGSGGIIVDHWHDPPRLVVAEWGKGRIARMEENGARTPLVIEYDDQEEDETPTQQPFQLLFTPLGDLMILDSTRLWQLSQATSTQKFPPLESLAASRRAHAWTKLRNNNTSSSSSLLLPKLVLQSSTTKLGGMALEPNQWLRIYVTMQQDNGAVVLLRLSLDTDDDEDEDDDDDDDDDDEEAQEGNNNNNKSSTIVLDYSKYASAPGAIEVDEQGNLYLVIDDGILMVSSTGSIVGKLTVPTSTPLVDLTLGGDKFLYMTTSTQLLRMCVRNGPLKFPTNLIFKS
jgi:hypothetical protein